MAHLFDSTAKNTSGADAQSLFADSALGVDHSTSIYQDVQDDEDSNPIGEEDHLVSEQLQQLAATAWACEEDHALPTHAKRRVMALLHQLELELASKDSPQPTIDMLGTTVTEELTASLENGTVESIVEEQPEAHELESLQLSLASTVAAMRLRQQEQRHLHHLTEQKLLLEERRSAKQAEALAALRRTIANLKEEVSTMRSAEDQFAEALIVLEAEVARKDVAINAMTSAVAGLEGWLTAASVVSAQQDTSGRYVVRGHGRFRGRIYVDDRGDPVQQHRVHPQMDFVEFCDGLKAWLRGFRDVEEELKLGQVRRAGSLPRSKEDYTTVTEEEVDSEHSSFP